MALPSVAIVGRPNVGKSSLLNALAGSMISIVEPTAGVTRDRISVLIQHNEQYMEVLDTGGYGIVDSDMLSDHIESQIKKAIEGANLILFVVDVRDGITPLDKTIAQLLRKHNPNVLMVANKADSATLFPKAGEFVRLGFGDAICISAANHMNKRVLMDEVLNRIQHLPNEKPKDPTMKIALVGKRNAGKSSFTNAIVGQDRMIVSEVAGTTRDAVDVRFERDGEVFVAIDTAGVRKKNQISKDNIEFYSYTRATKSIRRADVVLFLIDATLPISQVDKKLARFITDEYKACILVINKWDLAKDKTNTDDYADYIDKVLPGMRYAPIAFTTAKDGKNVQSVLDLAKEIFKQSRFMIPTAKLNKAVEIINNENIGVKWRNTGYPKIYYAVEVATQPITLLLFVNNPANFDDNYQRFILNKLRSLLPIDEVPIRLLFRKNRPDKSDLKD